MLLRLQFLNMQASPAAVVTERGLHTLGHFRPNSVKLSQKWEQNGLTDTGPTDQRMLSKNGDLG